MPRKPDRLALVQQNMQRKGGRRKKVNRSAGLKKRNSFYLWKYIILDVCS